MSSKLLYNHEVIMYRLDALEKRLENVERHLHKNKDKDPDLIRILLDLVKNGHAPTNVPTNASAAPSEIVEQRTASASPPLPLTDSFDALSCMARRRTVV